MLWYEQLFLPDRILITTAVAAGVALLVVSILAGLAIRKRQKEIMLGCRYKPRKRLMEGNEKKCFQLLVDLFGKKYYIIPQVEVKALLNHKVGTQDRATAKRFIEDKYVDFVLCNKKTIRPVCAVKMDDGGYSALPMSRRERKQMMKNPGATPEDMSKFFKSARIPFVYLPKSTEITRQTIIEQFSEEIYHTSVL